MTIQYVTGDLFANRYQVAAFAHGCNCQGSMGAGIATTFRQQYPAMYEEYRRMCKAVPRQFNLGSVFLWQEPGKPAVFNLGTQEFPGRTASYAAIETALTQMKTLADDHGMKSIAMPAIGTGYGRLSWAKVRVIIETVFADWPGSLVVYESYAAE